MKEVGEGLLQGKLFLDRQIEWIICNASLVRPFVKRFSVFSWSLFSSDMFIGLLVIMPFSPGDLHVLVSLSAVGER